MSVAPAQAAPRYDVDRVWRDFPILAREVHGKPLVFLDNAAYLTTPENARDLVTEQQLRLTERMIAPNPFLPRQ